jgi:hypothetical protein
MGDVGQLYLLHSLFGVRSDQPYGEGRGASGEGQHSQRDDTKTKLRTERKLL